MSDIILTAMITGLICFVGSIISSYVIIQIKNDNLLEKEQEIQNNIIKFLTKNYESKEVNKSE